MDAEPTFEPTPAHGPTRTNSDIDPAPPTRTQVHVALELRKGVRVFRLGESALSMPPPPPQGWVVRVRVLSAVGLKASDFGLHGRTSDPFVELLCCGQREVTSTVRHSLHPTWNETREMKFREPPEHLLLRLWDYDQFKSNDPLGFVVVRLHSLWLLSESRAARSADSRAADVLEGAAEALDVPRRHAGSRRRALHAAHGLSGSGRALQNIRQGLPGAVSRLFTKRIAGTQGALQFEIAVAPTGHQTNPLQLQLHASISSVGLSLIDVPEDKAPREVAYLQLQRLRTRLERRRDTSQVTMRLGTLQIDHTAAEAEAGCAVLRQALPIESAVLPTDLVQALVLLQHSPGREEIVETLELLLHSLQIRLKEAFVVDALRVLLPLLLTPPLARNGRAAGARALGGPASGAISAAAGGPVGMIGSGGPLAASAAAAGAQLVPAPPMLTRGGRGMVVTRSPAQPEVPRMPSNASSSRLLVPASANWEQLVHAPGAAVTDAARPVDREKVYMRLVRVGAVQSTISYASGRRGLLSRMLDSVLDAERAHFAASTSAGAGMAGGVGSGGMMAADADSESGGSLTEVLRAVSTVAAFIPDMEGIVLKFNEVVVYDAFTSWDELTGRLRAHYTRGAVRQWYKLIGSVELLFNPSAFLDKLGGGVIEFFRAPADGFISDGLVGLGFGVQKGIEALVLGAATGLFESVSRFTGAFCKLAEGVSGVNLRLAADWGTQRYEAGQLARAIAHAYKGVLYRPYNGAKTGGALGFGKGLLSFGVGFVAMPVVLALGGFSMGLAAAASHAERIKQRNNAGVWSSGVVGSSQPLRCPREFGVHGQIQPARTPAEQQRAEAEAATTLQRVWRQRRRGPPAPYPSTAAAANAAAFGVHRALTASRTLEAYVNHALHQHQARHARDASSVVSQRRHIGLGSASAFGFGSTSGFSLGSAAYRATVGRVLAACERPPKPGGQVREVRV